MLWYFLYFINNSLLCFLSHFTLFNFSLYLGLDSLLFLLIFYPIIWIYRIFSFRKISLVCYFFWPTKKSNISIILFWWLICIARRMELPNLGCSTIVKLTTEWFSRFNCSIFTLFRANLSTFCDSLRRRMLVNRCLWIFYT